MMDWSDDEQFWAAMEPALCAPGRLALAHGDVDAILGRTKLSPPAHVLDLGCGPGAHAIAMAARGHRVTGVDKSDRLLGHARASARHRGVDVEWVQADMRVFRRPESFDLICSLYTSFGYFDDEDNRQVVENVCASLRPGATFVLDVVTRETTARDWRERRWLEVDGVLYLERRHIVDDWSALVSDWLVVTDGRRQDFRVRQRLYSGMELRELLSSVGFDAVSLHGSLDGKAPYDESARRAVAIGSRRRGNPGTAAVNR